jgi:hypothetical protein
MDVLNVGLTMSQQTSEFINILEDLIFKETIKGKWKACIDDLYCWLVAEILKKEKVYIRCKKQSNWTSWGKRCCILTPRSVSIYTGQPDQVDLSRSTKKIELVLTNSASALCIDREVVFVQELCCL